MNIVVYCGSSPGCDPAFTQTASALGIRIAEEGHSLVYGGGAVGMMGALADAALDGGANVIGVIPEFMVERDWAHPDVKKMIITKDMHERKQQMLDLGDVYVALAGGTGTLEEIFEAVSWSGLGLVKGPCVFVNTNGYYDHMEAFFDKIQADGYMRTDSNSKVFFVDTIDELFLELEERMLG